MAMNLKFDNLLNFLSKKNQDDSVVGIDIGSSSIKVVELKKKKSRAVLHTYGEIALGPYAGVEIGRSTKLEAPQIAEALVDVLNESKTSTLSSAISIPMRSSMVSIFKMPKLPEKKLSQMIPIEARKYIPVPIAEVSLDWFVIPDDPKDAFLNNSSTDQVVDANADSSSDNDSATANTARKTVGKSPVTTSPGQKFLEAMVVAIHNDVLSNYSNIVSQAGLQTSFFEIEMFSTIRTVIDSTESDPIMIVDIGSSTTKVYISERGIIRDSHIINKGSQNITLNLSQSLNVDVDFAEKLKRNYGSNSDEQDKNLKGIIDWIFDPVLNDIRQILMNFQTKNKKIISKVVLVGGGALLNGLPEKAQERLEVAVERGDPFNKVEAPAFLEDVLSQTGASFSVAIGLALRKLQELE